MASSFWETILSGTYPLAIITTIGALILIVEIQPTIYQSFERVGRKYYARRPIHEVVLNGYQQIAKVTGQPFVVRWWAKDYIVLPPKYLADLRTASWRQLSFFQNISDALFLHTTVGDMYASNRMVDVVKKGINPRLPQLTPIIIEEINYAFEHELGDSSDQKKVTAASFFGSITHRVATRLLICEEVCRDEKFLKLSTSFVQSIFVTALVIVYLPLGPLRGLLAWPLSLLHRWKLARCVDILHPIVTGRIMEKATLGEDTTNRLDGIEWTLAFSKPDAAESSPQRVTKELLHNLWAGSSAPGGLLTEMVFQLLLGPQYLEPLRKEASNALQAHGLSEKMLSSLPLLDSFIRETNRLYPTGSITCSRTILDEPFQFSDGLTLPVGTRMAFPIQALQQDPDNFSNPLEFEAFRFAKLSTAEADVAEGSRRWGAASMGTTNLAWGYGNHVCPGRFVAIREVKLVFAKLLVEYEIKFDGTVSQRPPPVNIEGQFIPNLSQKICLRRRA